MGVLTTGHTCAQLRCRCSGAGKGLPAGVEFFSGYPYRSPVITCAITWRQGRRVLMTTARRSGLQPKTTSAAQIAFVITLVVLVTLLVVRVVPAHGFFATVDWRLLALLGAFMLLADGLKSAGFVEWIAAALARHARGSTSLYFLALTSAFVLAMLITNDAALFAVIPFTIALARRVPLNLRRLVIYEVMAVNLGSALTPWGNPQNLFIYRHYHLTPAAFFRASVPVAIIGFAVLAILVVTSLAHNAEKAPMRALATAVATRVSWSKSTILSGLFVMLALSVMRLIPVYLSVGILVVYMGSVERRGFKRLDWYLLGTFFLLFPTMSGLGGLLARAFGGGISSPLSVYGAGIGLSQVISNVPAAMLLSHAVADWRSLFYGVNLGGLGTIVASFANLIGLSLYLNGTRQERGPAFIGEALGWNALALVVLGGVFALFVG